MSMLQQILLITWSFMQILLITTTKCCLSFHHSGVRVAQKTVNRFPEIWWTDGQFEYVLAVIQICVIR